MLEAQEADRHVTISTKERNKHELKLLRSKVTSNQTNREVLSPTIRVYYFFLITWKFLFKVYPFLNVVILKIPTLHLK